MDVNINADEPIQGAKKRKTYGERMDEREKKFMENWDENTKINVTVPGSEYPVYHTPKNNEKVRKLTQFLADRFGIYDKDMPLIKKIRYFSAIAEGNAHKYVLRRLRNFQNTQEFKDGIEEKKRDEDSIGGCFTRRTLINLGNCFGTPKEKTACIKDYLFQSGIIGNLGIKQKKLKGLRRKFTHDSGLIGKRLVIKFINSLRTKEYSEKKKLAMERARERMIKHNAEKYPGKAPNAKAILSRLARKERNDALIGYEWKKRDQLAGKAKKGKKRVKGKGKGGGNYSNSQGNTAARRSERNKTVTKGN